MELGVPALSSGVSGLVLDWLELASAVRNLVFWLQSLCIEFRGGGPGCPRSSCESLWRGGFLYPAPALGSELRWILCFGNWVLEFGSSVSEFHVAFGVSELGGILSELSSGVPG